ncbi:MAG: IS5 family transposase [Roseiflexus sp.]|nr:MAG: IS5 family transposase [Roseiflexus sp.]
MTRKPYPSDVTNEEWAFVAPYLTVMREDAPQRAHDVREVFNRLRWIVRTGSQWRMTPNDLPPWSTVRQQTQRWMAAGVFEDMVHDLRALIRLAKGKQERPTAAIFDGRTVQSAPESGKRAGYDGYTRRKGSTMHLAADTLGLLLAVHVTPANEQERAPVQALAEAVQAATQDSVESAYVDQGSTSDEPKQDAQKAGIELVVVKLPEAKKGFVL